MRWLYMPRRSQSSRWWLAGVFRLCLRKTLLGTAEEPPFVCYHMQYPYLGMSWNDNKCLVAATLDRAGRLDVRGRGW